MTCTFDNVSIHLMTCRHIWQCVHPSHYLLTHLTLWQSLCWSISWQDLQTLLTMCLSISWPADTFDNVCVHPSYDLHIFLTVFLHPSISWHVHFWQWALLSLDNTMFPFSVFYKLFPGYNLMLMPLFCIPGTMTKTCSPCVVPKFGNARESSRASVNKKSPRKLQTKEQEINWLPEVILCGWQDIKIQLLTKRHNFVLAQFKV